MKAIPLFLILLFAVACKAQVNIKDMTGYYTEGTYYKDLDNALDDFTGTYIYTNGTTSLKFVFQKRVGNPTMSDGIHYTEDVLVGEYQYVENGVEKANTLMNFAINMIDGNSYSISGNNILIGDIRGCTDCTFNENRVEVWCSHSSSHSIAQIILRKRIVNGQPALEANIWWQMRTRVEGDPPLPSPPFPGGDFMLVKQ